MARARTHQSPMRRTCSGDYVDSAQAGINFNFIRIRMGMGMGNESHPTAQRRYSVGSLNLAPARRRLASLEQGIVLEYVGGLEGPQ